MSDELDLARLHLGPRDDRAEERLAQTHYSFVINDVKGDELAVVEKWFGPRLASDPLLRYDP